MLVLMVGPASGAITTISKGNTVFIGEEGLDISGAMDGDTQIGWWASAASIAGSAPSYTVLVSNPMAFFISPSTFGSQTGVWYRLDPSGSTNGTAFTVVDPTLDIRIEDTTVNVDVTDKWVPTDDEIRFRIDTNLVAVTQRSGVGSVPITIYVQDPSGGTLTALIDRSGTSNSIVDIPVTTTPFYTGSIWDTGKRSIYTPGTYRIWAECNVNSMKDNYNLPGKTVSRKASLQNQDHNPLITGNYPRTATRTPTPAAISTTQTTPAPVTTTPATVETQPEVITTHEAVTASETLPSEPVTSPTAAAKTPGFGGILTGVAMLLTLILIYRND
jgi:hypothetical protein